MLLKVWRKGNSCAPCWKYAFMLLLWKTIWRLLKILLLNIYPKKTKALVQKGTSTETESRLMVAWAGEGGTGWGVTVSRSEVPL